MSKTLEDTKSLIKYLQKDYIKKQESLSHVVTVIVKKVKDAYY